MALVKVKSKIEKIRKSIQIIWTILTNGFISGFIQGKIYTGGLKKLCLPGLNCYSCPGALGSCPIGSLQAVIGSREYKFSFYVAGFLVFVGAFVGRFVCGWLCPFGLFQGLLNKIPFFVKIKTFKGDKLLRKLKYIILAIFVILLPMLVVDVTGLGEPWFCKYLCTVGMLEGGIPLVVKNEALRSTIGFLYAYKGVILAITLLLSVIIYRPFCKYICPLGAIYSLFNRFSFVHISKDEDKCINCNKCNNSCKMNIDVKNNPNNPECIRCGKCISACPCDVLKFSIGRDKLKTFSTDAKSVKYWNQGTKKEEENRKN